MELKIGNVFGFNDKIYQVIADETDGCGCGDCCFADYNNCDELQSKGLIPSCVRSATNEFVPVIFKEIKLAGTVDLD